MPESEGVPSTPWDVLVGDDWYLIGGDYPAETIRALWGDAAERIESPPMRLDGVVFWSVHVESDLAEDFVESLHMPLQWRKRTWLCRRRLRFLLVRPRSREWLDRLGLITGVLYELKQ